MVNEACRGTGESHKEKSDVCTEMKHILHEEIANHLISHTIIEIKLLMANWNPHLMDMALNLI